MGIYLQIAIHQPWQKGITENREGFYLVLDIIMTHKEKNQPTKTLLRYSFSTNFWSDFPSFSITPTTNAFPIKKALLASVIPSILV